MAIGGVRIQPEADGEMTGAALWLDQYSLYAHCDKGPCNLSTHAAHQSFV